MSYTFQELQNEVMSFQFSEARYRPLVKKWLNQALTKAVLMSEMRVQETTQTYSTERGAVALTLPANFARLIDFHDTEIDWLLMPMDLREYDTMVEAEGRPTAYAVNKSEILLYPTPDMAYPLALRYWRLPAEMVNETDVPEIQSQYHDVLIGYAMWKAYLRENDYVAAKEWMTIWNEGILKMRGEVQGDVFDGPRQVGGSWGDPHMEPHIGFWR